MSEEWGPWIEHVPGPCPLKIGEFAQAVNFGRDRVERTTSGRISAKIVQCPAWSERTPFGQWAMVLRYRIRKPRGLTILENLIADLPAPSLPDRVPTEHAKAGQS